MQTKNNNIFYHLVAFLTVAIWGTTFVSTKMLLLQGLSCSDLHPAFQHRLRADAGVQSSPSLCRFLADEARWRCWALRAVHSISAARTRR